GGCGCGAAHKHEAANTAAPGEVDVLGEQTVGDYQAAALKADDADALGRWLTDHGYEFSPELKEWVKPYIAKNWVVSTFKIAREEPKTQPAGGTGRASDKIAHTQPGTLSTSAVRMTFHTDQPYFPYREPKMKREGSGWRLLRVYFVAEGRVKGTLSE